MLMANGKMRKFLVRAPKGYDGKKPLALIFAFHGGGADGASFETRIAAIVTAVGERGIFVYPDELPPPGGGQISWSRDYKDDLVFIDAIVDWLKQNLCYDTARVFSWGQSSGAYFANTVGCHRPSIFRAVSSNGGGVRTQEFVGCANMPVAAWISNGAMDPSHLPDARKARDAWVMINGCTMANPVKVSPDPCVSYQGCKSGFPVHYCENGGGHDIPAYAPMGIADFFFGNFDK
jgi:poly(3-hydroxybutyrate) depolymerase